MTIQQDQSSITLRQNDVDDKQTNLDNDKAAVQEIIAPFDGLITKVYTDSNGNTLAPGDIVARNTSLVEIADPNKFVANIMVTEGDVMSLKWGRGYCFFRCPCKDIISRPKSPRLIPCLLLLRAWSTTRLPLN